MNAEQLRSEIRRLAPWHEDIGVAPGIRTAERDFSKPDPLGIQHRVLSPRPAIDQLVRDVLPRVASGGVCRGGEHVGRGQ